MKVTFRPAQPGDVDTAVPLIYSSGPLAFDFVFKRKNVMAQDFLKLAFVDGRGEFGYKNHIVAIADDHLVGIGATYTGKSTFNFTLNAIRQITKTYGPIKGFSNIRSGLQIEKIIHPPSDDISILVHLGVAPEKRSQGVGTQLVEHLLEIAQQSGTAKAELDVSVENSRAQSLYERLGFKVIDELESNYANAFGRIVNHRRMSRPLR